MLPLLSALSGPTVYLFGSRSPTNGLICGPAPLLRPSLKTLPPNPGTQIADLVKTAW